MSQAADRNLLFGILAMQMDFITRDQLVAGMNAWVLEKEKPLGQILVGQGALDADNRAWLDAGVERHLAKHGNDAERSLAALPVSPRLKEQVKSLCHPEFEISIAHLGAASTDPQATMSQVPSATGTRYRVLRPHARGGLGEVFVAEDTELHREVALKEIQAQHAGHDFSRARFVLEAEITGGLEHPGIVPVYGLGAYADGRPFYVMRFIRGDNLKEAIARFHKNLTTDYTDNTDKRNAGTFKSVSSVQSVVDFSGLDFRQLLGRFVDVCNAVAYAHSRGVLHRDLKPGNIMLGKFGETLVVDWGLAKVVGRTDRRPEPEAQARGDAEPTLRPASGSGVAETLAGSAIGTPAYMSPEQAAGKVGELGPATDVYSLGATLFTILTNRPPIEANDAGEFLRKVQAGDIDWPRRIGSQPVPPALEAICRKAMSLRAADRYATPLALAEDIEHWLADEPVSAYGEPWPVRAGRWTRKHKTLVTSAAAAMVVGVIGLIIVNVLQSRTNHELAQANANEAIQRRRADTQLVASYIELGHQALGKGDRFLAALAYAEALAHDGDIAAHQVHRARLAAVLDRTPRLSWVFRAGTPVRHASFNRKGQRLVLAGLDGSAHILDTSSGQQIGDRIKHDDAVMWVTFSGDGERIATGSADRTARVWHAGSGKPISAPMVHPGTVRQAHFDSTGTKLLTAGGTCIPIWWEAETGRPLFKTDERIALNRRKRDFVPVQIRTPNRQGNVVEHTEYEPEYKSYKVQTTVLGPGQPAVMQAEFAARNRIISLDEDGLVVVSPDNHREWVPRHDETSSKKPVRARYELPSYAGHFAVSPDGEKLAVAFSTGELAVYDENIRRTLQDDVYRATAWLHHEGGARGVAFSPDGRYLVSGGRIQDAILWRIDPPAPEKKAMPRKEESIKEPVKKTMPKKDGNKEQLEQSISIESPLLAVQQPGQPQQPPDLSSPPELEVPSLHGLVHAKVASVLGTVSGNAATPATDAGALLNHWEKNANLVLPHDATVCGAFFSPDSRLVLVACEDHTARIWEVASGDAMTPPLRHGAAVRFAAWSPDGKGVVTCGDDGVVKMWDLSALWPDTLVLPCSGVVDFAAFSSDGRSVLTADSGGYARFWDVRNGQPLSHVHQAKTPLWHAAMDGSKEFIVTVGGHNRAIVWDSRSEKQLFKLQHKAPIWHAKLAAQERLLFTLGLDDVARVWELRTGKPIAAFEDPQPREPGEGALMTADIDSLGRFVVTGGVGPKVRIWNGATGQPLREIVVGGRWVGALMFNSDGRRLLAVGSDGAGIWDVENGKRVTDMMRHRGDVRTAKFSNDGKRVATGGSDRTARVWDADTGKQLAPPLVHGRSVERVVFSPDDQNLLTISGNIARVWDVATGQPLTPFLRHERNITWGAFDASGRNIVTASMDHTARIWRLPAPDTRPLSDLRHVTSELAGLQYDSKGNLTPVEALALSQASGN